MSIHQALLISEWGPTTFYLNGDPEPDAEALSKLRERGIGIEPAALTALHGDGAQLSSIELADGRTAVVDALYLGPRTRLNSGIAQQLGCDLYDGPFGDIVRTDDLKMTTVPGIYAAGDITRGAHNVTWAASDGVTAGVAVHKSLVL
jgi:thioredoxin reductase